MMPPQCSRAASRCSRSSSSSSSRSASGGSWRRVKPGSAAVVDIPWIRTWGIRFALGVDGISVMLVLLTTFIMPLVVLGGWTSVRTKLHAYHALMLILTSGMLGVFMARDLFLFYVMWEVMLVPMYFIVGIWGGARRLYAALKFFIFTMVGSLLMLVAILYLGIKAGDPATGIPNFAFDQIFAAAAQTPQGGINLSWFGIFIPGSTLLFLAFFSAFAVKVPMFPFHTWLPDAHVEAPTAGSVILASIMLKLGTYGFIRLAIPLFPGRGDEPGMRTGIIIARRDRRDLRVARGNGAAGLQEARRVLVGRAPWHGDARTVRADARERAGRDDGHDRPRPVHRRAVPPHRHDLRAATLA